MYFCTVGKKLGVTSRNAHNPAMTFCPLPKGPRPPPPPPPPLGGGTCDKTLSNLNTCLFPNSSDGVSAQMGSLSALTVPKRQRNVLDLLT